MLLTVGMAHFDDFYRCRSTVLSILNCNYWSKGMLEILIVDNSPENSAHSRELKEFASTFKQTPLVPVRYIRDDGPPSSYRPRGRIFEEAAGDFVLVMDCHIEMAPGTLNAFYIWAKENPDCENLLTGVYVHDAGAAMMMWPEMPKGFYQTHYDSRMRGEMWGAWAKDERGAKKDNAPFQIPSTGLGVFACRRESWLGFHPDFLGFGGGEKYLHDKYVQAGRGTFCLPFIRWQHGYQRIGLPPYPHDRYGRVRNMVIGAQALNQPLDVIYSHWMDRGEAMSDDELRAHLISEHRRDLKDLEKMARKDLNLIHNAFKLPPADWDHLLENPIKNTAPYSRRAFSGGKAMPMMNAAMTTSDYYRWIEKRGAIDYRLIMPVLQSLAQTVSSVTEFASRRETTIAFMTAGNVNLLSHTMDPDMLLNVVQKSLPSSSTVGLRLGISSKDVHEIKETELLYLDSSPHFPNNLKRELELFGPSVTRFIAIKGCKRFGKFAEGHNGDENYPGLWPTLRQWMADHPEWFVYFNNTEADLAVIGRLEQDRPEHERFIWPPGFGPGTNFGATAEMFEVKASPTCRCQDLQEDMDIWGWEGCEQRFDAIVKEIKTYAPQWGFTRITDIFKRAETEGELTFSQKLRGMVRSLRSGNAFKINPMDPFPGLVRLAIEDAKRDSLQRDRKAEHVAT